MQKSFLPSNSDDLQERSILYRDQDEIRPRMHMLANKLLPITVFAQLAVRQCTEPQILKHLEKIQHSAEEARLLVAELQHLVQADVSSSVVESVSDESSPTSTI